jgi:tripartite-type tricarboxylate transporter receptor subunit TctC
MLERRDLVGDLMTHITTRRHFVERSLLTAIGAGGVGALPWLAGDAVAAANANPKGYPNGPIKIVVAFPPGGLTDSYARMYAEQLTSALGGSAVVENKPGAGAILGIDAVAKAAPDGHTLLMTTSGTVWQNRVLYSKLPYNLDRDLTPIAVFPSGPLVVGVSEKVPATTMREFIAWAKQNPCNMGTYAPGSIPHMMADQLNRGEGTKMQAVHYRGESPMWVDLASGQIQVAVGSYQSFATVQTRGVKAIGVTGTYRSPKLPDVPTVLQQGVQGPIFAMEGGLPLMAPARTPEPVLQALSRVVVQGAESERAAKLREQFAIPNKPKNLAATRADWDRDVPVWVKLAVDLGVKLD